MLKLGLWYHCVVCACICMSSNFNFWTCSPVFIKLDTIGGHPNPYAVISYAQ